MGLTPNYGYSYFGGDVPGTLTDDGAKFTGADRLALDRHLKALASSTRHQRTTSSELEAGQPSATVENGGGLPGGRTYAYAVALVNEDGLETAVGPEVVISTPDILTAPDEPGVEEVEGGILPPGLYYFALTALSGIVEGESFSAPGTEESTLSSQVSITLDEPAGVQLTLPAPPTGALGYQIWRMGSGDVGWTRIAQVTATEDDTFTDYGSVPANLNADDPAQAPPATNAGVAIYAITITLAAEDAVLCIDRSISAWRLYRTETPSAYPAAALVHHVVDLDDPYDTGDTSLPLVTSWVDEGDVLTSGAPIIASSLMALAPYVLDVADSEPDPAAYPENYPLLVGQTLYAMQGGTWMPIGRTVAFRGPWSEATDYIPGDIVQVGPSLYQAQAPNTDVDPLGVLLAPIAQVVAVTNIASWTLVTGGSDTHCGQGFTVDTDIDIAGAAVLSNAPAGMTVQLASDYSTPTILAEAELSTTPTADGDYLATFPTPVHLTAGVMHWLLVSGSPTVACNVSNVIDYESGLSTEAGVRYGTGYSSILAPYRMPLRLYADALPWTRLYDGTPSFVTSTKFGLD